MIREPHAVELVSVITPLHNCAPFLAQTLDSFVAQTWKNAEMLLVDDCSTDTSVDIAFAYAARDPRIEVIQLETNSGPAVARNTAIERARGRYIAFLDSDDLWYPEKLEKQIAFMRATDCALSYTHYEKMTEAGEYLGEYVKPPDRLSYSDMLKSNRIGCLTAIYDAHKLGKVYMPLIRKRQDYGLWLKILRNESFAYGLPECLATYRIRSQSVSSNKLNLVKYNWTLFREVERLSLLKSAYYLGWNVYRKVFD